jgi:hypothetical protein
MSNPHARHALLLSGNKIEAIELPFIDSPHVGRQSDNKVEPISATPIDPGDYTIQDNIFEYIASLEEELQEDSILTPILPSLLERARQEAAQHPEWFNWEKVLDEL